MNDFTNQTLAQIVTADHRAATVFEKYHLDFCCKGKRSLSKACEDKALPTEQIVQELKSVLTQGKNEYALLDYVSQSQLCDYIVATHHAYVRQSIPQIQAYLEKVVLKHGDKYPYMEEVAGLFNSLSEELREHMFKEENVLFPRIKEIEKMATEGRTSGPAANYIEAPISAMEHEHDQAGNFLDRIREKTNNYLPPADACTTHRVLLSSLQAFEIDLHQHVHLENNILFPRATDLVRKLNHLSVN